MQIKLSRLKQIISEVVEEKYAGERMDDIMQSSREEEVVEEIDPHDQAIDDMIAEEIEAAMEAFVLGEGEEAGEPDDGGEAAGGGEAQGGGESEEGDDGAPTDLKPDVQKVVDRLAAIDNATEIAQLISVFLNMLSKENVMKALPGILKKAGIDSTAAQSLFKSVKNV